MQTRISALASPTLHLHARGLKYIAFSPMPNLFHIEAVKSKGFAAQLKDGHRKAAMEAKLLQDNPDIHQFYALRLQQRAR